MSLYSIIILQSILRTADLLKIKGLCELTEDREETHSLLNATLAGNWPTRRLPPRKRARVEDSGISSCATANDRSPGNSSKIDLVDLSDEEEGQNLTTNRKLNFSKPDSSKNDRLTEEEEQDQHSKSTPPASSKSDSSKQDRMASLGMGMGMVSDGNSLV